MSDDLGTTSEPNPVTGSGEGAPSSASASGATDASYWQAEARRWQSRYDQTAAQLSSMQTSQVSAPAPATPNGGSSDGLTAADIEGVIRREMIRTRTFLSESESLRSTYPDVAAMHPGLFEDPAQFDSPEALRATVERLNSALEERWNEREAKLREELGRPGQRHAPPPPTSSEREAGGLPTLEEINSWSPMEMARFETANPGLVETIVMNAMANEAA